MNVFRIPILAVMFGSGVSFAVNMNEQFRAHFNKGKELYAAGKFEEAASEFEAARAINLSEPVTSKNLALCYMQLRQYAKAEPLRKELCDSTLSAEDCLPYVEALVAQNKMSEAVQQLDLLQGERTPAEAAVENRFRCYAQSSLAQFDKAVEACRGGEPDKYQPVALNLLFSCLKAGHVDCAKEWSIKLSQKSAKDWLDIGKTWVKSATDEARKGFLPEYIKTAPDVAAKRAIALDLAKKGLYEESTPILEQVVQEAGGDGCDVAEPLARGYASLKADDKVMQWSSTLIGCAPDVASGYALRGIVHYREKNWDKAIDDFTKSLSITDDASVRVNLENAKKYKAGIEQQARAADEEEAAKRRAQEEYRRRVQKDLEDYCKLNPYAKECKDLVKPPPPKPPPPPPPKAQR